MLRRSFLKTLAAVCAAPLAMLGLVKAKEGGPYVVGLTDDEAEKLCPTVRPANGMKIDFGKPPQHPNCLCVWTGESGDGRFSNPMNWKNGCVPFSDCAVFLAPEGDVPQIWP
jgi:hypothetical protein